MLLLNKDIKLNFSDNNISANGIGICCFVLAVWNIY